MMRKRNLTVMLSLAALALVFSSVSSAADGWKPTRAVTIYCSSGAGGMTDLCNRALAAAFKDYFGVPFNVTNMVGGGGGTGVNHVYNLPRDGYSILGAADNLHGLGIRGAFNHPNTVWDVMLLTSAKGSISVSSDSPYKTLDDLVQAIKKAEESGTLMKGGASQAGCVWSVKMAQFNEVTDTKVNVLPYEGSTKTIVALLSGEIDVILCGLAEQDDYVKAGKIRPLAMIEADDYTHSTAGHIQSLAKYYPEFAKYKQAMQWGGIAFPVDTPKEIIDAYYKAFEYALTSKPVVDLATTRNVDVVGLYGEAGAKAIADNDSVFAWVIYESGLAVKSPEEFNIPRP